jgi:hypothetical protein
VQPRVARCGARGRGQRTSLRVRASPGPHRRYSCLASSWTAAALPPQLATHTKSLPCSPSAPLCPLPPLPQLSGMVTVVLSAAIDAEYLTWLAAALRKLSAAATLQVRPGAQVPVCLFVNGYSDSSTPRTKEGSSPVRHPRNDTQRGQSLPRRAVALLARCPPAVSEALSQPHVASMAAARNPLLLARRSTAQPLLLPLHFIMCHRRCCCPFHRRWWASCARRCRAMCAAASSWRPWRTRPWRPTRAASRPSCWTTGEPLS